MVAWFRRKCDGWIPCNSTHRLLTYTCFTLVASLARHVHGPQRQPSTHLGLYQPGTHLVLDGRQYSFDSFSRGWLQAWSTQSLVRLLQAQTQSRDQGERQETSDRFQYLAHRKGPPFPTTITQVGQLAGYVSEHSAYHHGDISLQGTIIGLAQQFVGSNNLNLLDPNGQFGTRLQGGKDAASARYIFTNVSQITRTVFHPADDNVLTYLNDDGQSIEPNWLVFERFDRWCLDALC